MRSRKAGCLAGSTLFNNEHICVEIVLCQAIKFICLSKKKDAIQQYRDNGDGVCQELSMADRLGALEAHANRAFAKKRKSVDDFIKDIDSQ